MKIGSVIKLKNNIEYAVAEIINYGSIEYLYIVNINDIKDIKFGTIENEKINFVNDNELFDKLLIEVVKKNMYQTLN